MDFYQRKIKEENEDNNDFLKNKHEISLLSESCQIVADTLNLIEKKLSQVLKFLI